MSLAIGNQRRQPLTHRLAIAAGAWVAVGCTSSSADNPPSSTSGDGGRPLHDSSTSPLQDGTSPPQDGNGPPAPDGGVVLVAPAAPPPGGAPLQLQLAEGGVAPEGGLLACGPGQCLGSDGLCYGPCATGACTASPSGTCGPATNGVSCCTSLSITSISDAELADAGAVSPAR